MTAYPNADDYVRAVQHPAQVFALPVLRLAVFEVHPRLGVPWPTSGNAAVVFKAELAGADTALRFFIREDAASRERYAALGRHFADRGIEDCVAHPTWLDDAISVNGRTWPVVQMDWVEGCNLDTYVSHLAGAANAGALYRLAQIWRELIARLQAAEFAHGDLQHGNVRVDTSSALRLVDFDGSWIAAFRGGPPPNETGHPNYQRTGREWGRWMDTFPGLVIYTALLALARRPELWGTLNNEENILFSAEDFDPPFQTRTWQLLHGIRGAEIDLATERLKWACDPAWRAGDTLEALLAARPQLEIPTGHQPVAATPFSGVGGPHATAKPWWELTGAVAGGPGATSDTAVPHSTPAPHNTPAPAAAGFTMPPPPPKTRPGPAPAQLPSYTGTRPTADWYQRSRPSMAWPATPRPQPGPAGRPARRPRSGQPWSAGTTLLVLAIAGLTALVVGGVVAGSGSGGGLAAAAAVMSALFTAALALWLLRGD